jgi:hypothetical protein
MEIGWTDVGSGGYILLSCAHSNTSFIWSRIKMSSVKEDTQCTILISLDQCDVDCEL